ncbi:hypothetical protein H0H81_004443 [Sphagnurus paluster]|uniref:Uncharacterized protein n=1 Tax=Sphagnurus paluster TaxID=117069 RepID=A0A9P7FS07_9AGAR|nr:hypothetical protein H0H81_004443 [Sphagnurus paluster]
MSQEDREAIEQMDTDAGLISGDVGAVVHTVRPGDEGYSLSLKVGKFGSDLSSMKAIAFSTKGVEHSLEGAMKIDTYVFLGKMERFSMSGVPAKTHRQRVSRLRADIRREVLKGLSMY